MIVLKKQEIKKEFLEKNGDAVIIGSKYVLIGEKNIYDTTKNNVLVIAPEKTGKDYGINLSYNCGRLERKQNNSGHAEKSFRKHWKVFKERKFCLDFLSRS